MSCHEAASFAGNAVLDEKLKSISAWQSIEEATYISAMCMCLMKRRVFATGRYHEVARQSLSSITKEENPHAREAGVLEELKQSEEQNVARVSSEIETWTVQSSQLKELDSAFGRGGIQSFALEGILGELQV